MARARVYQHQGDFQLAFADYDAASRLTPSPRIDACKGYCLNQLAQHKQAARLYSRSLEGGYDSPAVLNNLGYSWLPAWPFHGCRGLSAAGNPSRRYAASPASQSGAGVSAAGLTRERPSPPRHSSMPVAPWRSAQHRANCSATWRACMPWRRGRMPPRRKRRSAISPRRWTLASMRRPSSPTRSSRA